ncbi:MAG: peptidylprolyl isomerase [Ghiorsea sp.]
MLTLAGCQEQSPVQLKQHASSPVVAEVGEQRFYESDIDLEILSMPDSFHHLMQDNIARAKVLDVMIKRTVVAQKARDMGLNLDSVIAYRMRKAENTVLIQSIRAWQSASLPKPTVQEIAQYYEQHISDFIIAEQIHARHILVSDKQQALDILQQLKADPDSFSSLAAQYSIDDGNKGRGGDLNWFARGVMVDKFEKVAFALHKKHRLSQPVKTEFGWHIIEWLGNRESSTPPLSEVQVEISSILEKEIIDKWVNKLMNQANIAVLKPIYHLQ